MSYRCENIVWEYVRPSSSFQNTGTYAPPSTPRVHAFAAVPRTEPVDCKMQPPVGGIGVDICRGRQNPYRGGLGSFHLRFTYLREGGHQVSRSPGPGNYETRHLTGGALVKRPKTASPCFRRPGGRLQFEGGGAWHEETPLVSAERRGTVRGSLQTQPQHYSLSFRSKADRLVVNKPTGTTHEGIGPGCYDVSKDGKSVGVRTEKRVVRGGCAGKGSTNQFLVDWRAYMKRPYVDCGCAGKGGRSAGHQGQAEPSPSSALHNTPGMPHTASYTLKSQNESWPARKRHLVAASRGRKAGGPGWRLRESGQDTPKKAQPQQHRHPVEEEKSFFPRQQQPQHSSRPLKRRAKRPASAVASLRIPSNVLPNRCFGLPRHSTIRHGRSGGRSGSGSVTIGGGSDGCNESFTATSCSPAGVSGPSQFVPRPPSVDIVSRPRTACSAVSASQPIDDGADSCCCGDGRQSEGERGVTEVCAPRANVFLGKSAVEQQDFSGATSSSSSSIEAVHHARRPPTEKSPWPENTDTTARSERPSGVIEADVPQSVPQLALPWQQPQPRVNSTVRTEANREEDSSDEDNSRTDAAVCKPASGSKGGETTVRATTAEPCSDAGRCVDKRGHTVGVGRGGNDQVTPVPSGDRSRGASFRRTATSPPSSRRSRTGSDASTSNPSPGSRTSCSPRENTQAGTRPTSPPPSVTRMSSGTAAVAPTLASSSTPPAGQVGPEPELPYSKLENATQAPSDCEASSSSAEGGNREGIVSALWCIQSKNSFSSILDVFGRRSVGSSRSSSGAGIRSRLCDLDRRPSRPSSDAGSSRSSNHGSRNNSKGDPSAGGGGSAEQQTTPPRGRYKSFQLRHDSALGPVRERELVNPLAAHLAAAISTEAIISDAVSAVIVARLSSVAAGSGSGGGIALDAQKQ